MSFDTSTRITAISGVGKVRAEAYARMGVGTIGDLLMHYPRGYEDRADIKPLSDAAMYAGKSALLLTVATEPRVHNIRRGMSLLKFKAYDESGSAEITFFNQNYLKSVFELGKDFRFYGTVEQKGKKYFISSPDYEEYREDKEMLSLMPVYSLTEGISRKQIMKDVRTAVLGTVTEGAVRDVLPEPLRADNKLCTLSYALKNIHFPDSYVALAAAKKRLIYDEFLTFALGVSLSGRKNRERLAAPCPNTDIAPLLENFRYELTGAQKRVCAEIADDMRRDVAMSRLVVGDVGSGKTICAAAAMYIAVKNGMQAAIMAPTEILARQHFSDLKELFEPLHISCELLVGSLTAAQKKKIHKSLSGEGERIDVVVGTHALLSEGVEFESLGLIVTDEQHRFGVAQRALLSEKNEKTHVLVMSATPIPRSLALAVFGDLDVSRIDEMPPGRQRVDTFTVDESYRERLNGFIEKQVAEGGQVYVVCPSIEKTDEDEYSDITLREIDFEGNVTQKRRELKAAVSFADELRKRFPELRIEYIHGKLKAAEKDKIMLAFARGEVDILVSTTVIEVGVNVPNASLMIVENSERFGLSQLHQLRGRVGRGNKKSYCVLVSSEAGKENTAGERLKIMKECYNGYEIAERDLQMRGPGDFVKNAAESHIRQSGGVRFRLAELCDDTGLLKKAFDDATILLDTSPDLSDFPELKCAVEELFSLDFSRIS